MLSVCLPVCLPAWLSPCLSVSMSVCTCCSARYIRKYCAATCCVPTLGIRQEVILVQISSGPHPTIVNKRQPSAKILTKYLNYYFGRVRIVQTVILIQRHLPNISCCVLSSRSWHQLPIGAYSKEYRSENYPKLENFQYELMANLPRIHCPSAPLL